MSNYYLCDLCRHTHPWTYDRAVGVTDWRCDKSYARVEKRVMYDGANPLHICPDYELKDDEHE